MKPKSAPKNLPAECWGVLPTCNSIIKIKAGEEGYYIFDQPDRLIRVKQAQFLEKNQMFPTKKQIMNDFVDELNERKGITRAQRTAMEFGSQFGWDANTADPKYWEEIESFLKNKNFNLN